MKDFSFRSSIASVAVLGTALLWSSAATAGVPECNNLRLEDAADCEIRGDLQCEVGCEELSFEQACATKLHTVCREECVLDPEPSCTDDCTEACSAQCDAGVSVICIHNCFDECAGSCDASCEGADDPEQCHATCEATCDGECDLKCPDAVGASCYSHCIECCGGSCGAQANMTCQTSCQEEEFEQCTFDLKADCSGSCSGSGAIFCDGQYVVSGDDVDVCAQAVADRIGDAAEELVEDVNDAIEQETDDFVGGLCSCDLGEDRRDAGGPVLAFMMVVWGWRRRS